MSTHATEHDSHGVGHAPAPPQQRGYLMRPGWVRALLMGAISFGLITAFVTGIRGATDLNPVWELDVLLTAWTIVVPLGFLGGMGLFSYWIYWVSGKPTQPEDHSGHGADSWKDYFKVNTDHKVIGVQYLITVFFFFVIGGLMAMFIRAELAEPGSQYIDSNALNGFTSVHATLMIFLFVVPVFAGLGNYVIPIMLGATDMAFPRLNALSFWMLPIGGLIIVASFLLPGGAFSAGWTNYAPLATQQPDSNLMFQMGVQWAGASSIATALNFLVTIITMRAPGMTFWRMPLLVWANFTTSLLVVLATPFIAGSQFLLMFDRVLHTNFFEVAGGGYVVGYQHIFWFYSHPAVYIMLLPGFGIISEVLSVFSRKPIFGYRLMALSLVAILFLGFSVWAHHMFVAGMAPWLRIPMMITTLLIAVPTGVKVFSWLATLWEGKIHFKTPMLWAVGFISMFVIGGLSGIMLGSVPIDQHASDTYFIVAHIHYVLYGGSVFTIFAGVYYWFPKMTGRMYNETLGKAHFWLTFVSFNVTFFVQHYVGLRGMPRRVADYDPAFADWNMVSSIGSFVLGASTLIFLYNMAVSWRSGEPAPSNPWRAMTIEWQVSSPPSKFNFDEIPQVVGGPYEYGVPGARHVVLNGSRTLEEKPVPATVGAERNTDPSAAEPISMTSVAHTESDRGHDHGHGDHPPEQYYSSKVEPPILGIYLFLASEAMLFGSFFAAYFFARVAVPHEFWPPLRPGTDVQFELPVFLALINTIILVTSSVTVHWAVTSCKKNYRTGLIAGLGLTAFLGLAFLLIQIREYMRIGFSPRDEAFGSTFYALTGLHGVHVFMGLSFLMFALWRSMKGHYSPQHHLGLELPAIYWHFVDVMWIVVYVMVYVV